MKSNTKPWVDNDVLNSIRNHDKHYKKIKQSDNEIDKDNFTQAKLSLKKNLIIRKNLSWRKNWWQ